MERTIGQFLALGLIFGAQLASASPPGEVKDYGLKTSYQCHTNGVAVHNREKPVGGRRADDVNFTARPGHDQRLTFGNREYIIWPGVTSGTFKKKLNVLVRDGGKFKIVQEIELGDAQKTKTNLSLTVKEGSPEEKPVSCKIEMEWVKNGV